PRAATAIAARTTPPHPPPPAKATQRRREPRARHPRSRPAPPRAAPGTARRAAAPQPVRPRARAPAGAPSAAARRSRRGRARRPPPAAPAVTAAGVRQVRRAWGCSARAASGGFPCSSRPSQPHYTSLDKDARSRIPAEPSPPRWYRLVRCHEIRNPREFAPVQGVGMSEGPKGAGDDRTLVKAAQTGDAQAFRALVERYQRRVVQLALAMTKDADEAMDIAQETFVRVHRYLPSFKGDSSFFTWTYRIAMNLCLDAQRRKGRLERVDVGQGDEPALPRAAEDAEQAARVPGRGGPEARGAGGGTMRRCEEVAPLLGPLHDGALADDDRAWVEDHVRGCASCRDRLALTAASAQAVRESVIARARG